MVVNNTEIQKSLLTPNDVLIVPESRQRNHVGRFRQDRSVDSSRLRSRGRTARQIGAVGRFAGAVRRLSRADRASCVAGQAESSQFVQLEQPVAVLRRGDLRSAARRTRQTARREPSRKRHPADLRAGLSRSRDVRGRRRRRQVRPARHRQAGRARHRLHRNRRRLHRRQRFIDDRLAARVSEDERGPTRQRISRNDPARTEPGTARRTVQAGRRRAEVDRRAETVRDTTQSDRVQSIKGDKLGQIDIETMGRVVSAGREFWRHAALFGGVRRYTGITQVRVGDPTVPKGAFRRRRVVRRRRRGIASTTGTFRRAARSPTSNICGRAPSLGADDRVRAGVRLAFTAKTLGLHTFLLGRRLGFTRDGDAPVQNIFRAAASFVCRDTNPTN